MVKNIPTLTYLYPKQFRERMESINVGKYYKDGKLKNATVWSVYNAGDNKNIFLKEGLRFYDERPQFFSFFNGYDYPILESVDESKIELYLNHVREVIANNDEIVYEYIINWCSYIFQNITGKAIISLVITGHQGTGKNAFSDVLCNLMKRYSNSNVSSMDNVVGKFNCAIENKKLIVCNELSSIETNKFLNSDGLKSIHTEKFLDINQKNEPVRTIENVVNLIFLSNHFIPVHVEEDDRRYFMTETNDKYKDDFEYFGKLFKSFEDESFYSNLLTFFMKRDITGFEPRRIPMTNTKHDVLNALKTSYRLFVEEYVNEFAKEEGFNCKDAYEYYKAFCSSNGFVACASNKFGAYIRPYVERKRVRINGQLEWRYFVRDDFDVDGNDEEVVDLDGK